MNRTARTLAGLAVALGAAAAMPGTAHAFTEPIPPAPGSELPATLPAEPAASVTGMADVAGGNLALVLVLVLVTTLVAAVAVTVSAAHRRRTGNARRDVLATSSPRWQS